MSTMQHLTADERTLVQSALRNHPAMEAEDLAKLLFEMRYGCGHALPSEEIALQRLESEMGGLAPCGMPLTEVISPGLARLHLSEATHWHPAWIVHLMQRCAENTQGEGNRTETLQWLQDAMESLGIPAEDIQRSLSGLQDPHTLPSHSQAFREAESVHYRVILEEDARLCVPILQSFAEKHSVALLDGPSASGKTTLASRLQTLMPELQVVHMDDFYIPMREKTPERLAIPGGNADLDRLRDEILEPYLNYQNAAYRPYRCHEDRFLPSVPIDHDRPLLIEGAYALHPHLANQVTAQFFLNVDPDVQKRRIRERNGDAGYEQFRNKWIPLENQYRDAYGIPTSRVTVLAHKPTWKEEIDA